jgi:hypothetical protein
MQGSDSWIAPLIPGIEVQFDVVNGPTGLSQ